MDIDRTNKDQEIYELINRNKKEFDIFLFNFQNHKAELEGLNTSIDLIQKQFNDIEISFEQKIINVDSEISKGFQRELSNYEFICDQQTKTEISINEKFKQLESQNIKIDMVGGLIEQYIQNINEVQKNLLNIEKVKADKEKLELFKIDMQESLRNVNVEHDKLLNKVLSLANFADKYVPLIAQNITCDTLNQVVGNKERK